MVLVLFSFFFFIRVEIKFAQVDLELVNFLPHLLGSWDYRPVLASPARVDLLLQSGGDIYVISH